MQTKYYKLQYISIVFFSDSLWTSLDNIMLYFVGVEIDIMGLSWALSQYV